MKEGERVLRCKLHQIHHQRIMRNGVKVGGECCGVVFQSSIESPLLSLLMTIISLATEHSDPVAPHRVGVSMCVCPSLCVCVCVYITLRGKSVINCPL